MRKNYVQYCSLCARLNLRTKSLSALSGCLWIPYEISRKTQIFPRICIQQQGAWNIRRISNLLKTIENVVESEFKFRHISENN